MTELLKKHSYSDTLLSCSKTHEICLVAWQTYWVPLLTTGCWAGLLCVLVGPGTRWSPRPHAYRSLTGHLHMAIHTQCMFHLHPAKQLSSPTLYLIIVLCMGPPWADGHLSFVPFDPRWWWAFCWLKMMPACILRDNQDQTLLQLVPLYYTVSLSGEKLLVSE